MAGKTLSFFNLTGGLNTVQTMATINSTTNRTESPEMTNIEYFKLSGIRTMNGNVALNSNNAIGGRIEFGYEYIKGNDRYMIVADEQNLYEYNPTTDTFTKLTLSGDDNDTTFPFGHDTDTYITICGYANGIVAACPNSKNTYLVYYKKGRTTKKGKVSTTQGSNTVTVTSYSSSNYTCTEDIFGKGDIVIIGTTRYEVDTVQPAEIEDAGNPGTYITNPDKDKFTTVVNIADTLTDADLYISDFTKIYCEAEYDVQYSGITITTFTPRVIHSHQGRLWVAAKPENYDTTAVVIYSDLGTIHNAFKGGDQSVYDGGYFEEFWEDTSDITALGTWDKYIVVHKREHTYLINTSASDATTWNVESYSEYTCDNQRGFVKANNGYYVYTTSGGGIYPMIQRTIYSAISQGAEASIKIRDTFNNINLYALDKIFAVYHPLKKYIMFYMPMIGENGSNNCYILDLQTKSWLHRRVPQNVTTAFEFDNKVYIGTADGKVYEEFRGLDFAGETIKFSWKSPWFMWSGGTNWATTREIRVKMSQEGTNNFYIRNRRDGNEDYKQRTITNTNSKTNNLIWDEGILTGDINPNYNNSFPLYSYTDSDGNTWYSFDSELKPTSFIYSTKPTSLGITNSVVAATVTTQTEVTANDDWDNVEWGDNPIFAYTWKGTKAQYECFSNDGQTRIWVDSNDHTKGVINITQAQSTIYYAFQGVNYNYQPNGNIIATTAEYVNSVEQGYAQIGIPFYYWNGVAWVNQIQFGNQMLPIASSNGIAYGGLAQGYGIAGISAQGYPMSVLSYSLDQYRNLKLNRLPQYDGMGSLEWVWNGQYTRSGVTIDNDFTYNTTEVIFHGMSYKRFPQGDEGVIEATDEHGNPIVDTVFSNKETLSVGDIVYTTVALTTEAGTVEAVNGTNYTINSRTYLPDYSQGYAGVSAKYYVTASAFSFPDTGTLTGDTINAFYQIPNDTLADTEKLLTDSKWDESTWVNTGQVTKRFPIDRQYFQTLQLEFCGEVENQGIELYGFEVDGIQLTEVPW